MAYLSRNLSVIGYANGFTLWHYKSSDASATVDTSGYFNAAADMLRVGDFIFANLNQGATVQNGILTVTANSGTTVDVADLNAFGGTNTD